MRWARGFLQPDQHKQWGVKRSLVVTAMEKRYPQNVRTNRGTQLTSTNFNSHLNHDSPNLIAIFDACVLNQKPFKSTFTPLKTRIWGEFRTSASYYTRCKFNVLLITTINTIYYHRTVPNVNVFKWFLLE